MWIVGDFDAADFCAPGGRPVVPGENSHGSGLASAIGSEKSYDLPFRDLEADSIDRVDLAESFVEVFYFDGVLWRVQICGRVVRLGAGTLKDGLLSGRNLNDRLFWSA